MSDSRGSGVGMPPQKVTSAVLIIRWNGGGRDIIAGRLDIEYVQDMAVVKLRGNLRRRTGWAMIRQGIRLITGRECCAIKQNRRNEP